MKYLFYTAALLLLLACNANQKGMVKGNPPAEGFDLTNSDAKAIAIADEVMEAMGGRKNYDATRYLKWNFFGSRVHTWDKQTGDIRIDYVKENQTILMNIHSMEGRAMVGDTLVDTNNQRNSALMQKGKAHWINDAYWLVMPFKLKDSGVTLTYVGEEETQAGQLADVLALTFKNVGVTPDNKYLVYVDKDSRLVTQWDFYTNANDPEPRFQIPWEGYTQHGNIQLSGGRGKYALTEIQVLESLPAGTLTEF
ncbi:MAG: hypothetical protein AAF960_03305 [Bacteroidota bacterium]